MDFVESPPDDPRDRRQQGSVLLLSVLMMTALIVMGVGFLEVTSNQARFRSSEIVRYQARVLAESGTDFALQTLESNPSYSGGLGAVEVGGGKYEVLISRSGRYGSVLAHGEYGGVSVYETTTFEVLTGESEQIRAGTEVRVHKASDGSWVGRLYYAGRWEIDADSVADGVAIELTEPKAIGIDAESFRDRADRVVVGDHEFAAGEDIAGLVYVDGKVTLNSPCTLTGTLLATDDIKLEGGAAATLTADTESAVLLSLGKITLSKCTTLTVVGDIYCLEEFQLKEVPVAQFTGRVFTNTKFHLHNGFGDWLTPLSAATPPEVSGVDPSEWVSEVVVLTRRPGAP